MNLFEATIGAKYKIVNINVPTNIDKSGTYSNIVHTANNNMQIISNSCKSCNRPCGAIGTIDTYNMSVVRRLYDYGIYIGASIVCLCISPRGYNMLVYISDSMLSIRYDVARYIEVIQC